MSVVMTKTPESDDVACEAALGAADGEVGAAVSSVPNMSVLQRLLVAVAAGMLAGVLYVGDTTINQVAASLPAIPLAVPILAIVVVLTVLGTSAAQREELRATINSARNLRKWPLAGWALITFAVWLLWMMLSGLWAPEAADVAPVVVALLTLGLIAIVSALLFYLHPKALVWLWLAVAMCSAIFLYGGLTGPKYVGRMTAFGGGPNVFARFMVFGIAASFFFVLWRKYLWVVLVCAVPFSYGLVASGSRGALAASGVVFLFFAVALFFHWGWRWALAFHAAVVAAVIYGYSRFIAGTEIEEYFRTRFIELTFEKKHDSGRGPLHAEAFRLMDEHRVFGGGLHSFEVLYRAETEKPLEHPHNIIYTVGSEAGTIGIGLFGVTLICLLLACFRLFKFLPGDLTAAVALSMFLAQLASGYYYDSRPVWLFGFAAAFAMLALHRQAQGAVVADSAEAETAAEPETAAIEVAAVQTEPAVETEPVNGAAAPVAEGTELADVVKQNKPELETETRRVAVAAAVAAGAAGAIGWLLARRSDAKVQARAEKWLREILR